MRKWVEEGEENFFQRDNNEDKCDDIKSIHRAESLACNKGKGKRKKSSDGGIHE